MLTLPDMTFTEDRKFPGAEADGNIPDRPFVIVTTPSLEAQLHRELHRFFLPKAWQIYPYSGGIKSRGDWWQVYEHGPVPEDAHRDDSDSDSDSDSDGVSRMRLPLGEDHGIETVIVATYSVSHFLVYCVILVH